MARSKIERKDGSESRFESHGGSYCAPRTIARLRGASKGEGKGRQSLERGERIN